MTGFGGSTVVTLNAGGAILKRWVQSNPSQDCNQVRILATGIECPFEVELTAGQTLDYEQNASTNAELDIFATVKEFPA